MTKFLLIGLLLGICNFTNAQVFVDVKFITNENDTVVSKVKTFPNMFNRKIFDNTTFINSFKIQSEGKLKKIRVSDVKYLEYSDYEGKKIKMMSKQFNGNLPEYNILYRVVEEGKIGWYQAYYMNSYDRSANVQEVFVKHDGNYAIVGILNSYRKKLYPLIEDRPDLIPLLDNISSDGFYDIIKKYNQ